MAQIEAPLEWGYNCLTQGVYHGRPEALWNLPLLQAAGIFPRQSFEEIIISRIYNDAMQFVNRDREFIEQGARETVSYSEEWADKVKELAQKHLRTTVQNMAVEIQNYYDSPEWKRETFHLADLVEENKLNPHHKPLHPHDSLNMVCRILGTKMAREAS